MRRLLEHCGLPFEADACASTRIAGWSHRQLRAGAAAHQRDAVDQWRHYEPWLGTQSKRSATSSKAIRALPAKAVLRRPAAYLLWKVACTTVSPTLMPRRRASPPASPAPP